MSDTHGAIRPAALGILTLAVIAALLAGCGGSSSSGGVAHLGTSTGSSATTGEGASAAASASPEAAALAFARCMRAHGVPNFPDPEPGGGFLFHADPSSPAFEAAQAKCTRFLPAGPGSGPPPTSQALAKMLKVARCMRRHGVPEFPDPRTKAPVDPRAALGDGGGVISDIEGVILVFPATIDEQSALFTRTAAQCQFPLHDH
jgi:hypothetical protein